MQGSLRLLKCLLTASVIGWMPSMANASFDVTLEAEGMPTKTAGASYGGVHNLWSEGEIEQTVDFPEAGKYRFIVRAESTMAQNTLARFELKIDGRWVAHIPTTATWMRDYFITRTIDKGPRRVAIRFINDYYVEGGEDRNLIVDKIRIQLVESHASKPPPASQPDQPSPIGGVALPFGSRPMQYAAGTIKPQIAPSTMDAVIRESYDKWKGRYVAQMCGSGRYVVKGGQDGRLAVSEGQGYGMLIVAAMAGHDPQARTIFDGIHRFTRDKMSNYSNMMAWVINNDCSKGDNWPAVDGDLDMALALLMAHRQWGSSGSVNYLEEARKTIHAIKSNIVKNNYIAGGPAPDLARTSDFMFAHFRAFRKYTGDGIWDAVLDKTVTLIEQITRTYAVNTGLQPDFIEAADTNSPRVINVDRWRESDMVDKYAWNACRNPWRFGTDVVVSGDSRVRRIVQDTVRFFRNSSGGDPSGIKAVYRLDGVPTGNYSSMAFQAPIGVGAMVDSSNQAFLNNLWNHMAANTAGGYYEHSIQLLSMLVMSGNWWQP